MEINFLYTGRDNCTMKIHKVYLIFQYDFESIVVPVIFHKC